MAKKAKRSKSKSKKKSQKSSSSGGGGGGGTSSRKNRITTSSTAEYFSKNLQQVGFSSQTKAVLTTLKESLDNSLDACEDGGILPEVWIDVQKAGKGSHRNSDSIKVKVSDNGPGINLDDVPKVFGEYLASSKFGRGRCSRGQQGIGISAATTWAQLTSATGAKVTTKTKNMRKAARCTVEVDIKHNKGVIKDKSTLDWNRPHGTEVEFVFDGRVQINGEAGLMNYILGNVLVNPHLTLHYKIPDNKETIKDTIERVSKDIPKIPKATEPHPHTMKLGEFIAHSHLFGRVKLSAWLKKGFSRVSDNTLSELKKQEQMKGISLDKSVDSVDEATFKKIFSALQKLELKAPSTSSVLSIGEEGLAKSIKRIGEIDFFSVVSRRPRICDFKPVQVEVAVARLVERAQDEEYNDPVQVLRFANRVPLQFDKAGCAIVQAINSVTWRTYGLGQPKNSLPLGPYIIAVSVVSPFIKFKNASKETIDSSDELVEEIRRALMQAGQKLKRHIRKENKANELEQKIRHIEQFGPILIEGLCRITGAPKTRKKKAEDGLKKILGRDTKEAEAQLKEAHEHHAKQKAKDHALLGVDPEESKKEDKGGPKEDEDGGEEGQIDLPIEGQKSAAGGSKKKSKKVVKKKKTKKKASKKATSKKKVTEART